MIFVICGGSGSTFAALRSRKVMKCHRRIDVSLKPDWYHQTNINPTKRLSEFPSEILIKDFYKRGKYLMDANISIKENLDRYYHAIKDDDDLFSLSAGFLSCFNYLYENENINLVNYILRHPMHHSIAFFGPQKSHGRELERDYSSIFTKKGMDMYIRFYNLIVDEAIKMRGEGRATINLFENDLSKVDFNNQKINNVFSLWDGSAKHYNQYTEEMENYLKQNTDWNKLYDRW